MKRTLFFYLSCLSCYFSIGITAQLTYPNYDVVVYGATSSGVMAAVQCARMGKSVILIAPGGHLGGMTSNGLCLIDATDPSLVGGLTHDFFHRAWLHYQEKHHWYLEESHSIPDQLLKRPPLSETIWVIEPHVAEQIFNAMVDEAHIPVVMGERLERKNGVRKENGAIVEIAMESGQVFSGQIFIDATYEGDLMAAAGVSYFVGREANSLYNENLNGITPSKTFFFKIDPYIIPRDASSGLLPRIFPSKGGEIGEGDSGVQSYNYRMCLSDLEANSVRVEKPENYDEHDYEILFRAIDAAKKPIKCFKLSEVPNRKMDANNSGPISTDYIGMSGGYTEADYVTREQIAHTHEMWQKGLIWTLQNHPRVPEHIRNFYAPFGLPKDEFVENRHWPYELYVREARRMVSTYVVTEHTAFGEKVDDSIGLASYPLDSHAVKYYVSEKGIINTEGGFFKKFHKPFPISYRAIIPRREECHNLLVPVCLSASHVAYGSIRMEPVFMIVGQSAATAACLALEYSLDVQDLPYQYLREKLLADSQVLEAK